jgi:hypothetical protein
MHWTAGFRLSYMLAVAGPPPVMSIVRHLRRAMKLTRFKFRLGLGLLFAALGIVFIVASIFELVGPRAHGLLRFYEFVAIGPLLFLSGAACCYDKDDAS